MNGSQLKAARIGASCTQQKAARKLGVTQAYLSMVERGNRPLSSALADRAVECFEVSATALPIEERNSCSRGDAFFAGALAALGYAGFFHLRGAEKINPAELLMHALDCDNLDPRVTEGLPWVAVAYPDLDWEWLTRSVRLRDRQNRLAFAVALASQAAGAQGNPGLAAALASRVAALEPSRLAAEGTLCRESMTRAERDWVRIHRSPLARHWNLLTDLTVQHLDYISPDSVSPIRIPEHAVD